MQTKLSTHYKEGDEHMTSTVPMEVCRQFYSEWSPDILFPDDYSRGCISASQGMVACETMPNEAWPSVRMVSGKASFCWLLSAKTESDFVNFILNF